MLLLWFVSVASAAVTDPTAARHEFLKNGTVEIVEYAVRPEYSADDDIEIFFGEYRIASWFVSMAPWNIYHGGLQFKCRRTNYTYTIDYNAKFDFNITHFLVPTEQYQGDVDEDGFPTGTSLIYNGSSSARKAH
ncbi:hypothetical protein FOZ63_006609 [Perkinsus olseni]|uniref:Uncharacterized protein n=1 Tax=Perkinsus olseni TaxID=32597 RepID=A0A7J6TQ26_PEROL|nr:hypothetical protein FOZ63_006609 [Perkinsus olseni]KAF4691762.1 hypothetical protein FOZ60_014912 [Perkinsus olseni]KAF4746450.1 hypothetical protein FOZ62_014083 [Perkinsus olseni]